MPVVSWFPERGFQVDGQELPKLTFCRSLVFLGYSHTPATMDNGSSRITQKKKKKGVSSKYSHFLTYAGINKASLS